MNQSILISRLLTPALVIALAAAAAIAQTETKPPADRDLDLTLQVLAASSDPGAKVELPQTLSRFLVR